MKKILRSIFNKFGYDFIKINMHSADKASKTFPVQVGKYQILMPGNNPQISLYKYSATSNIQLGNLATIIAGKYADATIVDIGANVGDTIAVIKSQIDMPVIAVEGDPVTFAFLQKNVTQFNGVTILNQYLGEEQKELAVTVEKDGWNSTLIPNDAGTKKLQLKTFDEVLTEQQLQHQNIKLLKIDTEGFDTIILRGCTKTIEEHKPVLYFEYNGENMSAIGEDGLSTLLSFKNMGYNTVHIYDCIDNLIMVTTLDNADVLKQLDEYAAKKRSMIPYYDMCVFHTNDADLSDKFLAQAHK